jgi:hypothetical protein
MIERALSRPDIWLSIVIDGMDQKKTMFPRLATRFELDPDDDDADDLHFIDIGQ